MSDVPLERDAARFAGLILMHREAILAAWVELVDIDPDDPAAPFIRNQLDATILALADWLLGADPADSSMSFQWIDIKPTRELTVGAIVSMSLLPEAVRSTLGDASPGDRTRLLTRVGKFSGEVTGRLLASANLELDGDRWDQIARDVESRYEKQRALRVRRLSALIDIAHAVSTSQEADTLLEHVQQTIVRLSGADYIEISLLDAASKRLRCRLVYGNGRRREDLEQTLLEQGLANEVLKNGTALTVSDYATGCRDRDIPTTSMLDSEVQRAWMGAPMRQGDQIIGVIAVSGQLMSFDQEDVELLAAIARQTAVALENLRLIEAQSRHVAQLSAVNHLARETAELRDAGTLMQIAVERIQQFFGYGLVTAFRLGSRGDELIMQARAPISMDSEHEARALGAGSGSIVGEVAQSRKPALYPDVSLARSFMATESTRRTRSEMAVPIIYSGELLGVLDVQSERIGAFDTHDLTTLQTIADQIAIGLENGRLLADEAQRTRELRLMLDTTRAASSSLLLDEVLERLAEGIASTAGTSNCLIHLYDADEHSFRPAVLVNPDPAESGGLLAEWNRPLPVDGRPDLQQVLDDPFPQLMCQMSRCDHQRASRTPVFLIPLRTRQRTLGLAIVASESEANACYPLNKMRLLQGVADSAALAVENARLYARAHGLAIAEERGRLAQEIHDTLAQGLTAISLQLDLADSHLPEKPDFAARNVRRALELTRQNLDEARRSVLDLRAADVHHMSLPDAISQLLRRLSDENAITYEFDNDGLMSRLSARVEVGLYRILEEALENARQHSAASNVHVTLQADGKTVAILVEDDGVGFDPGEFAGGYGLLGIRERARLLGGSLTISSTPGVGASLRVVVPYEARIQPAAPLARDQGDQA